MPPDPILALLCLVGLFVYVGVGSCFAALHLRAVGWRLETGDWYVRNSYGNYKKTAWGAPAAAAAFWPIMAFGWVLIGLFYGLGVGPAKLGRHVISYTYSALEKERNS